MLRWLVVGLVRVRVSVVRCRELVLVGRRDRKGWDGGGTFDLVQVVCVVRGCGGEGIFAVYRVPFFFSRGNPIGSDPYNKLIGSRTGAWVPGLLVATSRRQSLCGG